MKDYNGFSPSQRMKAQNWLKAQWSSGALPRPSVCVACGQDEGRIDAHAEDYSEPFRAGVTDEFHLCFVCHMMVHCRHRNPDRWNEYRSAVESGAVFPAIRGAIWPRFQAMFLGASLPDPAQVRARPKRRVLSEIESYFARK